MIKSKEEKTTTKRVQIKDNRFNQSGALLNTKKKRKYRERAMSDNLFDDQHASNMESKIASKRIKH
jgi:hypothetical protein